MAKRKIEIGDLVLVYLNEYDQSLGLIVDIDSEYHIYELDTQEGKGLEFNNSCSYPSHKFQKVHWASKEWCTLIEKGNTKIPK